MTKLATATNPSAVTSSPVDIAPLCSLIESDMTAVDHQIQTKLHSNVELINQLSFYIINSGGKRLRPRILILAAKALGYSGNDHATLAVIIEFIHTATLLHDDVVDGSDMRRGQKTANNLWGDEASVLVGDFLYSRSFEMMVGLNNMRVMEILAKTTNTIAEGEVLQLLNCHNPDTSEQEYLDVIHRKTAKLFEAAAQLGGLIANCEPILETALAKYGMYLGTAFQLIDDVLDYSAATLETGKNIGDDLAEGKPTLPLIHTIKHGSEKNVRIITDAIQSGGLDNIDAVIQAIHETDAVAYTASVAKKEAALAIEALAPLPHSIYKDALITLAEFSVTRNH